MPSSDHACGKAFRYKNRIERRDVGADTDARVCPHIRDSGKTHSLQHCCYWLSVITGRLFPQAAAQNNSLLQYGQHCPTVFFSEGQCTYLFCLPLNTVTPLSVRSAKVRWAATIVYAEISFSAEFYQVCDDLDLCLNNIVSVLHRFNIKRLLLKLNKEISLSTS